MAYTRDGRRWRLGTRTEVDWIAAGTVTGHSITSAIPPVYEAYATFHEPVDQGGGVVLQERALVRKLMGHSPGLPWWLGYLDTGAHDTVFGDAPKVSLYADWSYVLVEAGPEQALTWRTGHLRSAAGALPDLFFPADRSWLVSALWDDTWTCLGGSAALVRALQADPLVAARPVRLSEPARPPGAVQE